MQAVWLENQVISYRKTQPEPVPAANEALVRIRLAGICSTDLEMRRGYYPFCGIPGHEFVGEVVRLGSDQPGGADWLGKRVVGEINIVCHTCAACRAGHFSHCEARRVVGLRDYDGIFAEYARLPLENLHLVPETVTDEQAVFTEPLAAALEIPQQVHLRPADRVLLVGAGRLGLLVAQVLRLSGCDLQVVARRENPRRLLSGWGIRAIEPAETPVSQFDVVVEATGSPDGFELACQALRPAGTLVLKSTYVGSVEVNLSRLVVDEITVIGSRCGPFAPALVLLEHRLVDPAPLISARFPFAQAEQAFQTAAEAGCLKVLLHPAACS